MLRPMGLLAAAGVAAIASQLQSVFCVLAVLTAVLVVGSRHTVTSGMSALLLF
jgi:hypothetical protein